MLFGFTITPYLVHRGGSQKLAEWGDIGRIIKQGEQPGSI